MNVVFNESAWQEFVYWFGQDRKTVKRINLLIKDILSRGVEKGLGKPEPLKYSFSGYWSRRIDEVNRLVYCIEEDQLKIIACKGHYA